MNCSVMSGIHGTHSDRLGLRTVASRNASIVNSPDLSDVKFIFKNVSGSGSAKGQGQGGETIIYGNKLILALASPVFHRMFYMDKQNEQFVTTVNADIHMDDCDITAEAFLKFIRFLYTDKICYKNLEFDVIVGILSCADYYDVPCLKKSCANQLEKMITTENVFRIMGIAETYMEGHLAYKALDFMDRNLVSLVDTEEILCIKFETLFQILRRDSLDIDESFVLDLALKWAGEECSRKNRAATGKNKREVLGKVFFEIRFGLLTSDRIFELVSSNLLTARESLDVVLKGHTPGYVTTADNSRAKRRRLAPELGFKSSSRIFGHMKKLMEVHEIEKKWKERNNYDNLKASAVSLANGRTDLWMRGFPRNKTEHELRNEIQLARSVFDLEVEKCGVGWNGKFLVKFKYNSDEYVRRNLWDPAWYGFDDPDSIQIIKRGDNDDDDD